MATKFQPPPDAPDTQAAMSDEDSGWLLDQTRRALFAANPALASNNLFKGEFDDAFHEFITQGGQGGVGYEKAWRDTVMPVIDKWQTVPQMPQMAKWQPNDVEKYKQNLTLAGKARMDAAKINPTTDEGEIQKRSLVGIAANAQKNVDDIEAKYPVPPKFQAVTDIPELPQGKRPSDLGFGAIYRVGKRVFQNFSPTPLPPGAKMQIGGSVEQGPPVAPGASADDGSAPPPMKAAPRFQIPTYTGSNRNAPPAFMSGPGMLSAPVAPAALSPSDEAQIMGVRLGLPPVQGMPNSSEGAALAKKPTRVRVIGPKGEKGTIESGDKLPEGWKLVE